MAARFGRVDVVKGLLARGSQQEAARDQREDMPLHAAARSGMEGAINVLLEAKADVDATNRDGSTALHLAAGAGHLPAVKCLLRAKANRGLEDGHALTPVQ
jgi:ankyrin repeat protein